MRCVLDLKATLQKNKAKMAYNEQTWQPSIQKRNKANMAYVTLDLATKVPA